jgi:hypothetical protein
MTTSEGQQLRKDFHMFCADNYNCIICDISLNKTWKNICYSLPSVHHKIFFARLASTILVVEKRSTYFHLWDEKLMEVFRDIEQICSLP